MRGTRQLLGYQLAGYAVCRDCAEENAWLRYGPGRVGIYEHDAEHARECVVCQDRFAGPITGLVLDTDQRESIAP